MASVWDCSHLTRVPIGLLMVRLQLKCSEVRLASLPSYPSQRKATSTIRGSSACICMSLAAVSKVPQSKESVSRDRTKSILCRVRTLVPSIKADRTISMRWFLEHKVSCATIVGGYFYAENILWHCLWHGLFIWLIVAFDQGRMMITSSLFERAHRQPHCEMRDEACPSSNPITPSCGVRTDIHFESLWSYDYLWRRSHLSTILFLHE